MSETATMTLTEFITARLDEKAAHAPFYHDVGCPATCTEPPLCECDLPERRARVLREVEAMRRIVALHERESWHQPAGRLVLESDFLGRCVICGGDNPEASWPCDTLRALASIWRDHPDFQEEWA